MGGINISTMKKNIIFLVFLLSFLVGVGSASAQTSLFGDFAKFLFRAASPLSAPSSSSNSNTSSSNGMPGGLGEFTIPPSTGSGDGAVFPQVNTSAGSVLFQKVFFDNTDNPDISLPQRVTENGTKVHVARDLAVASFGSKKFLFQLTGTDVWVYDITADPFNPALVQGGDLTDQSLGAFDPQYFRGEYAISMSYLQVADGVPYGIVGGGRRGGSGQTPFFAIFRIDPATGNVSYVHRLFGSGAGFYPDENGGIFVVGGKAYLVGQTTEGAPAIFDFSNPQTLPLPLVHEFPYPYMNDRGEELQFEEGTTQNSGLRFMRPNLVFTSGQTPYLLMYASAFGSYNDEGYLHSMTEWSFLWDLSSPSSPTLVDKGKTKDWLKMREYLTSQERSLSLVYPQNYAFDSILGNLFATAGIGAGNTTPIGPSNADYNDPDVVAGIVEQLEEANRNIRQTQASFRARTQLGVYSLDSSRLSAISVIPLAEQDHMDTYRYPKAPRIVETLGGIVDLEYFIDANTFSSSKDCYSFDQARIAYQQNGNMVYLTQENDPQLSAFRSHLKNASGKIRGGYGDQCVLAPSAVALVRVNANTVAAYRAKNLYAEVDKITVAGSIPQGGAGGGEVVPPQGPLPPVGSSLQNPTLYSFNNLLNVFGRILRFGN